MQKNCTGNAVLTVQLIDFKIKFKHCQDVLVFEVCWVRALIKNEFQKKEIKLLEQ